MLITKSPELWIITCGKCGKERNYSTYKNWKRAQKTYPVCLGCSLDGVKRGIGEFSRKCPNCNSTISYKTEQSVNRANSRNRLCSSCCNIMPSTGRLHSNETKQKIKEHHARPWQGTTGPWFGKFRSENMKCKLRQSIAIRLLARGTLKCNPKANQLFELVEDKLGFDGQFGSKGGEFYVKDLGYFVDYYEPTKNLVIEFDEKYHTRYKYQIKDAKRQNEITTLLGCKFIRVSEDETVNQVITKIRGIL